MNQLYAGREWVYEFTKLPEHVDSNTASKVADKLGGRYSKKTKQWTAELNSEWLCRSYMAAKCIMSATLHISSSRYAESKNLRVVVPYLKYYAAFSLCRAICFTVPEWNWNGGCLLMISHKKAIDGACDFLAKLDNNYSKNIARQLRALKANRELVSYRAPSSGDEQIKPGHLYLEMCRTLAEVSQFNSEILERSVVKHADPSAFELLPDYAFSMSNTDIEQSYFGDVIDAYRFDYVGRKFRHPVNLQKLMTEDHVDDFFGAWTGKYDDVEVYDPDTLQSIIFDVP